MSYVGRGRDLSLDENIKNMKQIFYYAFIILLFMSCNQESVVKEAPIRYVKPGKTGQTTVIYMTACLANPSVLILTGQ